MSNNLVYKISKIEYIQRERFEAEVTVTDGEHELVCYSDNQPIEVGQVLTVPILALDCFTPIRISAVEAHQIRRIHQSFAHDIVGTVENRDQGWVRVGEFLIEIDAGLPLDIQNGETVAFVCERLDLCIPTKPA